MTIDDDKIKEWRALCEQATPRPWGCAGTKVFWRRFPSAIDIVLLDCMAPPHFGHHNKPNAAFIAAAREALPALLDAYAALRERLERQASWLKWPTYRGAEEIASLREENDRLRKERDEARERAERILDVCRIAFIKLRHEPSCHGRYPCWCAFGGIEKALVEFDAPADKGER